MTPCNDSHENNSSEPSGRTLHHAFGKTGWRRTRNSPRAASRGSSRIRPPACPTALVSAVCTSDLLSIKQCVGQTDSENLIADCMTVGSTTFPLALDFLSVCALLVRCVRSNPYWLQTKPALPSESLSVANSRVQTCLKTVSILLGGWGPPKFRVQRSAQLPKGSRN